MDPFTLGAIGLPIVTSLIGSAAASGSQGKADKYARDAAGNLINIEAPTLDTSMPATPILERMDPSQLQQYSWLGDLQTLQQGDTELGQVYADPRLQEARMQALRQMQNIANEGGLTAIDKARMYEIQQSNAQKERGAREAILQNANARGVGGSGLELAAQLQAQQSSADRNASESMQVNAMAQQRALQALMQGENMAGNLSREDLALQSQRAQAQDAINSFNTRNGQQVAGMNWSGRQNLANAGVDQSNQQYRDVLGFNNDVGQQRYNNDFGQTKYGNDVTISQHNLNTGAAESRAQGSQIMSGIHAGDASRTRKMWSGLGNSAADTITKATAPAPINLVVQNSPAQSPGVGATTTSKEPYQTFLDDDEAKQSLAWKG